MSERKIAGWVVALMPEKKGERRQYFTVVRVGSTVGFSADKSEREVFDTPSEAADVFRDVARWIESKDLHRLRILPLYAEQKRTVEQERADVVAWLEDKFDRKAADEVAAGAHVGAAK